MTDRVDLNTVVRKATGLAANLIRKSTRRFSTEIAAHMPLFDGNTQRLEQVVINLVVNACQALPDRERAICITTFATAEHAGITVADEGEGIPAGLATRITDPFFTTKRESGGTGLGLAITSRIVRDHGGTITFDSTPGQGTTVRVTLPLEAETDSPQEAATTP